MKTTTTPPDSITRVTRSGLWCDQCNRSTRTEVDVCNHGLLVVTLTGCSACGAGLQPKRQP